MSAKMELAAKVASGCTRFPMDTNSGTTAFYARKYTVAELRTLEAALTYADSHSRQARYLFDAAAYSERTRKIAGASGKGVLKAALTAADADAWYAANFPAVDQEPTPEPEPTADSPVKVFLVVVDTKKGLMDVELIGTTAGRAADRARWSLIHGRQYGDIDQVQWISVEEVICQYFAACTNTATRFVDFPGMRIPTCQRCHDKAESLKVTDAARVELSEPSHTFDGMPTCGKDTDGQGRLCNDDPGHDGECTY